MSSNSRSYALSLPLTMEPSFFHRLTLRRGLTEGLGGRGWSGSAACGAGKLTWEPAFAEPPDLQPRQHPQLPASPTGHQPPGPHAISIIIGSREAMRGSDKWNMMSRGQRPPSCLVPHGVMDCCSVAPVLTAWAAGLFINRCKGEFLLESLSDTCPVAHGMPGSWGKLAAGSLVIN